MDNRPVRVIHAITRMCVGGAQENTLHTCDGLRQRPGWEPLLVTGPTMGPEGELLSEVRQRGIPHVLIPSLRRAVNPCRDAAALAALVRVFRWWRPTIVQTHSSKAGILGRFAAHLARVPIVIHTVEGLPFHPYAHPLANAAFLAAERTAARVTDHIVCVARAMVDGCRRAGLQPRTGYSIIRSGIDVDAYEDAGSRRDEIRSRFGFGPQDTVIGKIARLFPLKGHRFLLEAAPRIVRRCPGAKFLLVGSGILRQELERTAARAGLADRVVFAGLVPPRQIPALIAAMDVLVHTSLREGLPRVLVEALLCRRPVVTFELDGAPEVIQDGETGRLVPAESVDELVEAVVECIENPRQARRMAQEGRRRFAEEFRIETMVKDTVALYRRLLGERR